MSLFRLFVACVALASCAAPALPLPPVPPPPAAVAPRPVAAASPAASRSIMRDSAALRQQAGRFVVLPSVATDDLEALDPLTRGLGAALNRMEVRRTPRGYRRDDVALARARADELARFLNAQGAGESAGFQRGRPGHGGAAPLAPGPPSAPALAEPPVAAPVEAEPAASPVSTTE